MDADIIGNPVTLEMRELKSAGREDKATLQIKLGRALGKTPLNPIHIWVKHVLPKIFWA